MNASERAVFEDWRREGYSVLNGGWPDFLCVRTLAGKTEVCCIEVKSKTDHLTPKQNQVHNILAQAGVPVRIIRPDGERIGRAKGCHRGVYEKVKGSNDWYICYVDAEGRRHREHVGRRSTAIEAYANKKREIREYEYQSPKARRNAESARIAVRDLKNFSKKCLP
jgi:hypothetical protein